MNLELAHDLLAKQIFQRLTAEEKAMRKAERLLRDGHELDQDLLKENKRRLLSAEDIAFIKPYLKSLQVPDSFREYFEESEVKLRAAEEAEKKELQKRLQRQRYLIIGGTVLGIIILILLVFSIRANLQLNEQVFENELARAKQYQQAEQYDSARVIYNSLVSAFSEGEQFDRIERLKAENDQRSGDAKMHKAAMDSIQAAMKAKDFQEAKEQAEMALEISYKPSEAKNQQEIIKRESRIAFNTYKKRGMALFDLGERQKACDWLNKAYQLDSTDIQIIQKRKNCLE